MRRFFSWVWKQIKKIGNNIRTRTFFSLGFTLTWLVPIYLLNSSFWLTQAVETKWKLSFMGVCVAVFVLVKWYGAIKSKIEHLEPKTKGKLVLQFVLLTLQKGITLTAIGFFIYWVEKFIITFNQWYFASLIPISLGFICYLIDRIIMFKKKKAEAKAKVEQLKEQIKSELNNG